MRVPIEPVGFRIEGPSEGLRFVIPQKWKWGVFLALPVELSLFAFFAYLLFKIWISVVFAHGSFAPKAFISLFSLIWFALLGRAIFPWFWNLAGRHILVLNGTKITLRQELCGVGRTRVFDVNYVSHWRYVPEQVRNRRPALPSGFAFDFAGKEVRAGTAMEEAEVKQLFTQIRLRFPSAPGRHPPGWVPNENGRLHTYGGWRDTPRHAAQRHELG